MIAAAVALSVIASLGVNYGIYAYKKHEITQQIVTLEEKYKPLFNDCYIAFMVLANELKKDKELL